MRRLVSILAIAMSGVLWLPVAAQADFGIKSLSVSATEEDGSPALQAGSHPYEFTTSITFNTSAKGFTEGRPRDLIFNLPPGMVGDPFAVPRCSASDFEGALVHCPGNTQVGVADVFLAPGGVKVPSTPIYNLTPPPGVPASFGTSLASVNGLLEAGLRSSDYGIDVTDVTLPTEVELEAVSVTIWGAPAEASHDPLRQCFAPGVRKEAEVDCASDSALAPFLTLPTSCTGPLKWTLSVNSLEEPETFQTASVESIGPGGVPTGLHGCEKLPFAPSIKAQPESAVSDSPTGLHFNLHLPQAPMVTVGLKPVDEVQSLQITATSGVFRLEFFKGNLTGAIGSGDLTSGSTTVDNLKTQTGKFLVGEEITGPGIPPGTTIESVEPGVQPDSLTLSAAPTESTTGAVLLADLPFDASAAQVQAALEALPSIGSGGVAVSSESPGSYLIAFQGSLSKQNVPPIKVSSSSLVGPPDDDDAPIEVTVVQQGIQGPPDEEFRATGKDAGLATAHLKDTTVTLPPGLVLNPSAADGRTGCPLTGPEGINLPGSGEPAQSEPAKCPDASKVGTVTAKTPLLDHPVMGSVYLARQGENPFNSLLALYIAVNDPETGVVVKLAGKVEPDPATGQLRTTFKNNPQLPVEDFDLEFFGGPRAPLTTPPTCGTYTTTATLTPWSSPEGADAFPSDPFQISSSPGGACPGSEASMPNDPSLEAGTTMPLAASYSPFVLRLSRENGSQRLGAVSATLPPGLTGKLAGIERCSEAQLAVAASREKPGDGALERQSPSCPAGSQVGTVTVGAGSGAPFYAQGKAYLSGPYKGAPLSLAIITPAVAGPFDLGAVLVRAAAHVNPKNAQITVKSDPLPTILEGIPLDVRSVVVEMSRERFILNPTNCDPMSLGVDALSSLGQAASLSNRFQVGGCRGLDFEPKFNLRLKGGTKRGDNPKLIATVKAKEGEANIARASVKLPRSAFLDQAHIRTVCTRVQFAAEACPPGSIYGKATAITPLLDEPLRGNVYLRSSNNKLPDLVVDLRGPASLPIRVELAGRTDSVKGALRNTFDLVPDAPVSKFRLELLGGKRGLVINSTNICSRAFRATVKLRAHSGAAHEARPVVQSDCGGRGKRRG
jgi:hypothetical protein